MKEMLDKSLFEHIQALRKKEYSSLELTRAFLDNIREKDEKLNAYITVTEDEAIKAAVAYDNGQSKGAVAGIPYGLKDNICTKGIKTTCASKMLEDFVSPYNAFVAERLQTAGGVLLGKLNMDEFAMGATTELSAFKKTRNPLDPSRVPGGSSGGAAAAVVGGEAVFALGSETGGSIRQPAAFCGAVGMKPTYGRVSRNGLVAYASSLDQIGPITKTVKDNAIVLGLIAGHDINDATSSQLSVESYLSNIENGVKGLRIGIPDQYFGNGLSEDVAKAVLDAADQFVRLGAEIVSVSLPSFESAVSAYYIIACSEASSNLARYDGVRYGHRAKDYSSMEDLYKKSRGEGFGSEVKKRIMMGTLVLSEGYYDDYYKKASLLKQKVKNDHGVAFEKCDLILAPVAPTVAYKLGETVADPTKMYLNDAYTVSVNLAELPAISIPCGIGEGGMPVGMQLIGPKFSEALIYRAAYAYENREGK